MNATLARQLTADAGELSDAIKRAVCAKFPEVLEDARQAIDANMAEIGVATFSASTICPDWFNIRRALFDYGYSRKGSEWVKAGNATKFTDQRGRLSLGPWQFDTLELIVERLNSEQHTPDAIGQFNNARQVFIWSGWKEKLAVDGPGTGFDETKCTWTKRGEALASSIHVECYLWQSRASFYIHADGFECSSDEVTMREGATATEIVQRVLEEVDAWECNCICHRQRQS